jgi:hypothetical protein
VKPNFLLSFIRALKLPLKLLAGFLRSNRKSKKSDLEKKQLVYVRNFSPRHYGWQKSLGEKKKLSKEKKASLKGKEQLKAN